MNAVDPDACYGIAPGHRMQWEEVQQSWVILYPEGMVQLNDSAAEVLRRCDGVTPLSAVIADLEAAGVVLAQLGDEVVQQRKLVTVLFVDIAGSTNLIQGREQVMLGQLDQEIRRGQVEQWRLREPRYLAEMFLKGWQQLPGERGSLVVPVVERVQVRRAVLGMQGGQLADEAYQHRFHFLDDAGAFQQGGRARMSIQRRLQFAPCGDQDGQGAGSFVALCELQLVQQRGVEITAEPAFRADQ